MIAGTAFEGRGDRRIVGIDASRTLTKITDQVARIARVDDLVLMLLDLDKAAAAG